MRLTQGVSWVHSLSVVVAGEAVDRLRQALPLLVDPLLAGVGLGEGLGELDRRKLCVAAGVSALTT